MEMLSLFSGVGMLDHGLELAGIKVVGQCEIEPFSQKVLAKHWPTLWRHDNVKTLCRRMEDNWEDGQCAIHDGQLFGQCQCVSTEKVRKALGPVELVSGGAPCQPFSRNGTRDGIRDSRHLWPDMRRVVTELQPAWVLFENVSGAVEHIADLVASDLEEDGYAAEAFCMEARQFGADHRRERLFIIANNQGQRIQGLRTTRIEISQPLDWPFLPLRDCDGLWQVEPDVRRSAYGTASRLDGRIATWGQRLHGIGNGVDVRVALAIGRAIIAANIA